MTIWSALRGIIADRVFIIVAAVALATGIILYEIKGADAVAVAREGARGYSGIF